ncbi:glutathione S-transferase [Cladophialophora psammophila CBS 110553]|uniref:Glutathione S-transferase n=1 Tax=Cladophialophora psammophila CBS 110553 TaxID=1182543 RepID=W9X5N2_9EURO|nr:glutathione S-transferase [Cladophialophora psammophila CBS 110553]EXJ72635.1 glutathione S-transferase [Cladophialophora psammophila CBS 110553]
MSIQSTKENPMPAKLFNEKGELQRPVSQFRHRISSEPDARFSPEKGRYHLYVSYACPWAHRTLIVRRLKGLESIISVTSVHYHTSIVDSWRFVAADESLPMEDVTPDPLHPDFKRVKELYYLAEPNYTGRFTVPVLWDKKTESIVSNESSEIIRMLYTEFDQLLPEEKRKVDLYPEQLRGKIDEVNGWTYDNINNGVYKCGFAQTQSAYHTAVTSLFASLDRVEQHLSAMSKDGPYYFGGSITEADIRLYVTIIRFDPVYVSLFKTNRAMIRTHYPHIHHWVRNLYWNVRAFRDTTSFDHIKGHYFMSLTMLNPSGIVPEGPVPDIEGLVDQMG